MIFRFFPFRQSNFSEMSEFIFKTYYKTAYRAAFKCCGDHILAEEAAQETIYKAIKSIDQLKDYDKVEAWVRVIARNTVIKMIKKSIRAVPLEHINEMNYIDINPLQQLESSEIIEAVKNTLLGLSEPYYSVLNLFYIEELKIREVSIMLGLSEGTLKSILHRGRKIIKTELMKKGFIDKGQEGEVI